MRLEGVLGMSRRRTRSSVPHEHDAAAAHERGVFAE
jgi:hypothetical protein